MALTDAQLNQLMEALAVKLRDEAVEMLIVLLPANTGRPKLVFSGVEDSPLRNVFHVVQTAMDEEFGEGNLSLNRSEPAPPPKPGQN